MDLGTQVPPSRSSPPPSRQARRRIEEELRKGHLPRDLEAALGKVPAEDREATREFVLALARQGAEPDVLAWHIAKRTPGAKLPPVASHAKRGVIEPPPRRSLPARIELALAKLSPEARASVDAFAHAMARAGMSEETIGLNLARHLGLITPEELRQGGRRPQRRRSRNPYMTHRRQVLLALVAILARRIEALDRSA